MTRENCSHDVLARQDYLYCFRLACTMSLRQCLINQGRGRVWPVSLYWHCRNCQAGRNVARHFQGIGVTAREVKQQYATMGQQPEGMVAAKMGDGYAPARRKQEMIKDVQAKLREKGKNPREVHRMMVELRCGDTAQVREIWKSVCN